LGEKRGAGTDAHAGLPVKGGIFGQQRKTKGKAMFRLLWTKEVNNVVEWGRTNRLFRGTEITGGPSHTLKNKKNKTQTASEKEGNAGKN